MVITEKSKTISCQELVCKVENQPAVYCPLLGKATSNPAKMLRYYVRMPVPKDESQSKIPEKKESWEIS